MPSFWSRKKMCNLKTRNHFQTRSCDQVNDITNQRHLSNGIPSVHLNFKTYQKVEKMEVPDFFHEKLGQ